MCSKFNLTTPEVTRCSSIFLQGTRDLEDGRPLQMHAAQQQFSCLPLLLQPALGQQRMSVRRPAAEAFPKVHTRNEGPATGFCSMSQPHFCANM